MEPFIAKSVYTLIYRLGMHKICIEMLQATGINKTKYCTIQAYKKGKRYSNIKNENANFGK